MKFSFAVLFVASFLALQEHHQVAGFSTLKLQARRVVASRSFQEKRSTSLASTSNKEAASTGSTSEVERLLAKAAALRAEAAKAEHQVHTHEAEKKQHYDEEMDKRIDHLFFTGDGSSTKQDVVNKLKAKRLSVDTLKGIITRLNERELAASGKEHIDPNIHSDHTDFHRVRGDVDEVELKRLDGLVERLIDAVAVLDAELKAQKEAAGKGLNVNHIEAEHFGGLDSAKQLDLYYHEIRREHDEQFQKRQEEFFEAQRIKNDHKAPPKQKDHMMHP